MTAVHNQNNDRLAEYSEKFWKDSGIDDMEGYINFLYKAFSKKEVLENVMGYETNRFGSTITYTFNPEVAAIMELYLEMSKDYMDDDILEELDEAIEEMDLAEISQAVKMEFTLEKGYLGMISTTYKVKESEEYFSFKLKLEFSDYNCA